MSSAKVAGVAIWPAPLAPVLGLGAALAIFYFAPSLPLALVGAAAFLALAVFRPDLGVHYALLSAPFYLFPRRFGDLAFSLTEFTILATALAWGLRQLWLLSRGHNEELRYLARHLGQARAWPAVALFLAAALVSLPASEFLRFSLRELRTVVAEPLVFYLLLLATVKGERQRWALAYTFLFLGFAVAAFTLYHYAFVGVVEATGGVRRALAIYHSPNALGLFLGRVAPFFVALGLFDTRRVAGESEAMARLRTLLYALGGLVVFAALFVSYSRGAWFGVAVALGFIGVVKGRRPLLIVAGAGAAALAAVVAFTGIGRLISLATNSQRLFIWNAALRMIRDHPLTGVGLDNFLYQYPRYMLPEAWREPNVSHPHNIVLDYWSRLGLLGLASLALLQVTFWRKATRAYGILEGRRSRALLLALMAGMVDFLSHGLVDNSYFLIDLAVIFWFTFAMVELLEREGA